jgi:hypothetical protein
MFDWNNDEHDRMADTTTTLPIPRQRFSSNAVIVHVKCYFTHLR